MHENQLLCWLDSAFATLFEVSSNQNHKVIVTLINSKQRLVWCRSITPLTAYVWQWNHMSGKKEAFLSAHKDRALRIYWWSVFFMSFLHSSICQLPNLRSWYQTFPAGHRLKRGPYRLGSSLSWVGSWMLLGLSHSYTKPNKLAVLW